MRTGVGRNQGSKANQTEFCGRLPSLHRETCLHSKAALVSQQAGKFPLESAVPQSVFDVWDRSSQIRQALFKSEYSEFAGFGEDFLVLLAHFFGNFFSRCKLGEFHVVTCRAESLHKRLRTCLWKTGVGKRK